VKAFAYETDPREDLEKWRAEGTTGVAFTLAELDLRFGGGGLGRARREARANRGLIRLASPGRRET